MVMESSTFALHIGQYINLNTTLGNRSMLFVCEELFLTARNSSNGKVMLLQVSVYPGDLSPVCKGVGVYLSKGVSTQANVCPGECLPRGYLPTGGLPGGCLPREVPRQKRYLPKGVYPPDPEAGISPGTEADAPPPDQRPTPSPPMTIEAGGAHPTGMHSWFFIFQIESE